MHASCSSEPYRLITVLKLSHASSRNNKLGHSKFRFRDVRGSITSTLNALMAYSTNTSIECFVTVSTRPLRSAMTSRTTRRRKARNQPVVYENGAVEQEINLSVNVNVTHNQVNQGPLQSCFAHVLLLNGHAEAGPAVTPGTTNVQAHSPTLQPARSNIPQHPPQTPPPTRRVAFQTVETTTNARTVDWESASSGGEEFDFRNLSGSENEPMVEVEGSQRTTPHTPLRTPGTPSRRGQARFGLHATAPRRQPARQRRQRGTARSQFTPAGPADQPDIKPFFSLKNSSYHCTYCE